MSDRLFFSTDTLPERDRFPAFCEEIVRRYTGLDMRTQDQAHFRAAIELQRAGSIDIGHVATTSVNTARTSNLVSDGDDSLIVTLLEYGRAYQTQRKSDRKLDAGDAIICDCGYPGELNFIATSRCWSLKVPRNKIASLFPRAVGFGGMKLDKDPIARRLLFGYLDGTFNIDLASGDHSTLYYEEHVIDLIALALGAEGDARELVEQRSVGAVRRAAILHRIEHGMRDPALSATAIASQLGITSRYLRLLLEETGRSFSEHVLEMRLEHAAELLRDPGQQERKVSAIAFACGFSDLSYFNRAFRRRYGETPTDMREAARRQHRD
jgi:AraC-like DNA-binding protein